MSSDPPAPSGSEPVSFPRRLDELEVRSAYHERAFEDLDEVVREFAERVQRLEQELKELRTYLEGLGVSPHPVAR